MKQIIIYVLIATGLLFNQLIAQGVSVNREYQTESGNPVFSPLLSAYGFPYSKSIHANNDDLVTVGHSFVGSSEDVHVRRQDADGNVIFDVPFDILSAGKNDYAIDISEAPNGDFLICGATETGGSSGYDSFVLRISSSGSFINENVRDGGYGQNDFAVGIIQVGAGNVLVSANAQLTNGMFDCWVIQYDANLNYQNESFYDFAGLSDVAIGLQVDFVTGEVQIIAASASGVNSCDYAVARFDFTTLAYLGDSRTSLSGSALDKPLAFCRDANNNTYITGMAWSGTNFQIKTVKVNANNTIGWTKICDPYGLENVGSTIQVDANGDIMVGGYVTANNNKKKLICIKYQGSTGNEVWATPHIQAAENSSGDSFIKKIALNLAGDIYFVGSEHSSLGNERVLVGKIKSSGAPSWQKNIGDDATINYLPSDIICEGTSVYIITVKDSVTDEYITTAFDEFELDTATTYNNNGDPLCKSRELIVRFLPSALNTSIIDDESIEFGGIDDFLTSGALTEFNTALGDLCRGNSGNENNPCGITAIKVFKQLKTTHNQTISRLGETIPIPDFWTTLLLSFPQTMNIGLTYNTLQSIPNTVAYSEPDFIIAPTIGSTDTEYAVQHSIHNTGSYPNAHINVEEAWDIIPGGGASTVRCGVFDAGIYWAHEDFGYDGTNPNSSKVVAGWNFLNNTNEKANLSPDADDHGTACAGIIGAIRNNSIGIAGIAGGNFINSTGLSDKGVSLYSMHVREFPTVPAGMAGCYDAMVTSAIKANSPAYAYGLHISSNSWRIYEGFPGYFTDTNLTLLKEAVHFANRAQVTFVAARGNEGYDNLAYPAIIDDDWVLNVGGSGHNGAYMNLNNGDGGWTPSFGHDVDIAAPSAIALVRTTHNGGGYQQFNGTSAAAPHVAGAVGLLMSYLNDTIDAYQNLAPEDCEQIIQRSASPISNLAPLPDDSVGYGRLNIGKALRLVDKPCHKIWHFGTKYFSHSITKNQVGINDTVFFTERCQDLRIPSNYLKKGKYVINTWQIDALVTHNLTTTDTIKAYWPRPSMSDVWEKVKNKKLQPRERDTILSCNNSQALLRGYIYKVSDTLGNVLGWWPCDTLFTCGKSNSLFEYSILTKSCNLVAGIKEDAKQETSVLLFPNPVHNSQILEVHTDKVSKLTVDIYDMMGRHLKRVFSGKSNIGKTTIINDVNDLAHSLYIYIINVDGEVINRKFIKN